MSAIEFTPLEPRQLLAVLDVALASGTNLAANGGFEDVDTGITTNRFTGLQGWTATGEDGGAFLNIFELNTERQRVLNIDATADQIDSVFQDIDTVAGNEYVIAVDFRERPVDEFAAENTNDLEVFWDGQLVGTFTGTSQWQTAVIQVQGASTSDVSRLEFREAVDANGLGGDGRGVLLDNVRVTGVVEEAVINGDFETLPDNPDNSPFFASASFAQWSAFGADISDRLLQIDSFNGSNALNLDTSADHVDRIFQDLDTVSDSQYVLRFDLTGVGADQAENELRVRWNDAWAGTFFGQGETESYGLLLDAESDLTRLVFREVDGPGNNGTGPIIDNVQLFRIGEVSADLAIDLDTTSTGNGATAVFTENGGATSLLGDVDISHESGGSLSSVRVRIDNAIDGASEILSADPGTTGLEVAFNSTNNTLLISTPENSVRDFTISDFEQVLSTVTYENTAAQVTGGVRDIAVRATDDAVVVGSPNSFEELISVEVSIDNDVPVITAIADQTIEFNEDLTLSVQAIDNDPGSTLTYNISTAGDAVDGATSLPEISSTGLITWTPDIDASGTATITVTVTDDRGETATEIFDVNLPGFQPFLGNGQLANVEPALRNGIYGDSFEGTGPPTTIDQSLNYTATISTPVGDIVVNLFEGLTPISVNQFVNLSEDGFYDGLAFHRVVETALLDDDGNVVFDDDGNVVFTRFVAQAGDPTNTSTGGPGYRIADEILADQEFDRPGILAWARTSAPNTNGSQFFITYDATEFQDDENFTIFGEVIDFGNVINGENALDRIALTDPSDANPATPTTINSITIQTS